MKSNALIFLSGGVGSRMQNEIPKQYLMLGDRPIVWYSFRLFLQRERIKEVVVVAEMEWHPLFEEIFDEEKQPNQKLLFAFPGKRRQDSVFNGFKKLSSHVDLVAVHDGCRPFITEDLIETTFDAAANHGAAAPSLPVTLTIKQIDEANLVKKTIDRSSLQEIQTPQVVAYPLLQQGLEKVRKNRIQATDDLSLVEAIGHQPKLVEGLKKNLKITHPEDLEIAKLYEKL